MRPPSASPASTSLVPVFRPDISDAEIEAVVATLRSGWIGTGPRTVEFERRFAAAIGAPHAIAVSSGTAALHAALAVLGVGPGTEVIMPSFTWISVFQAVIALGATPVFADIEPTWLTLDPEDVARHVTPRTAGIVAVHHGGQIADVEALGAVAAAHGIWMVEDAAHACGARWRGRPVGSLGAVTCFSFNAMKNLAVGDGGMIVTDDPALAKAFALYRSLGIDRDTYQRYGHANRGSAVGMASATGAAPRWDYDVVSPGQRLHMNDITAAIGLVQLDRLSHLNARRGALVERYLDRLADMPEFSPVRARPGSEPSHHMFTVRMPQRDTFIAAMAERGITVGVHYRPIHLQTVARPFHQSLPVTEAVWPEVTTFPLFPAMTLDEHDRVVDAARDVAIGLRAQV